MSSSLPVDSSVLDCEGQTDRWASFEFRGRNSKTSRTDGPPLRSSNPVYWKRYLLQNENNTNLDRNESDKDKPFVNAGESKDEFFERVYDDLHGLAARQMRSQAPGHTLQATALVSELFIKLDHYDPEQWKSRNEFIAMASAAMRSILVDHARSKNRKKRKAAGGRVGLDEAAAEYEERSGSLIALDEALCQLGDQEPDLVVLVELHFFGRCSMEECGRLLGKSLRTVQRDWRFTKSWLRKRIDLERKGSDLEAM